MSPGVVVTDANFGEVAMGGQAFGLRGSQPRCTLLQETVGWPVEHISLALIFREYEGKTSSSSLEFFTSPGARSPLGNVRVDDPIQY